MIYTFEIAKSYDLVQCAFRHCVRTIGTKPDMSNAMIKRAHQFGKDALETMKTYGPLRLSIDVDEKRMSQGSPWKHLP